MSIFDLISLLVALTAGFAWVNGRYLRLPPSIGILVMGLAASTVLVLLELVLPTVARYEQLADLVRKVDFQTTVMNRMLAFLLFVGRFMSTSPLFFHVQGLTLGRLAKHVLKRDEASG